MCVRESGGNDGKDTENVIKFRFHTEMNTMNIQVFSVSEYYHTLYAAFELKLPRGPTRGHYRTKVDGTLYPLFVLCVTSHMRRHVHRGTSHMFPIPCICKSSRIKVFLFHFIRQDELTYSFTRQGFPLGV